MIASSLLRLRLARTESPSLTPPAAEHKTLHHLLRDRSKAPCDSLQQIVEAASELCETDCAGITRLERLPDGTATLRWSAATGPLRPAIGESLCLDRNLRSVLREHKPRLIFRPHRLFSHIAASWNVAEALLVPWNGDRMENGREKRAASGLASEAVTRPASPAAAFSGSSNAPPPSAWTPPTSRPSSISPPSPRSASPARRSRPCAATPCGTPPPPRSPIIWRTPSTTPSRPSAISSIPATPSACRTPRLSSSASTP